MSDFLLTLIATAYAAIVGLGTAGSGSTDAEGTARKSKVAETRVEARNEFKRAENKANLDYQAAIVDCKKKPPASKQDCLEAARAVNDKVILDAKAVNDRLVAEALAAGRSAEPGVGEPDTMSSSQLQVAKK